MKDFFDVSQFFTPLLCMAEWYGEGTVPPIIAISGKYG